MNRRKEYEKERNRKRLVDRKKARIEKNPPNISENGKKIKNFMISKGIKGNYRYYAIITGNTLMDAYGSYTIAFVDKDEKTLGGVEGVILIHKRDLKTLIGEDPAKKFWHPRLGRAGAFIKPGTKKNCTDV